MLRSIKALTIANRRILLRTDFNVPLQNGVVLDTSRIDAVFPTLNFLLKKNPSKIIILTHLGRPEGKIVEELRVRPLADYLTLQYPHDGKLVIEENLRFNSGEEANDLTFARQLAAKGDVYVNDAFAVSHRKHASVYLLPSLLPSAIGLSFQAEITALEKIRRRPKHPLVVVLGGAKLETKLPFIEKFLPFADKLLIGGRLVQEIRDRQLSFPGNKVHLASLTHDGLDITRRSAREFSRAIKSAATVFWNGPLGLFEQPANQAGTRIIAQAVNNAKGFTVIGGGDTLAAAAKFQATDQLDHLSLGGGAMLEYLASGTLPGLEALQGGKHG